MRFKVVILNSAEQDLKELRAYILKNFSAKTWQTSYNQIKKAIHHLQEFPQTGSIPEEIEKLNLTQYRQMLSDKNRIIYEVRQKVIYIHMIVDARRDMSTLLNKRLVRVM